MRSTPARIFLAAALFVRAVSAGQASQFLWLSDIHLNPFDDPALTDKLAAAQPSEWKAILESSTNEKLATYRQDTNWPLFASALTAAKQTIPNPAFVLLTGDLLAHMFRQRFNQSAAVHDDAAYRDFVHKTVEFVAGQVKQAAPNAPVFLALGNNDSECGNYLVQPQGAFLQDIEDTAAALAGSGTDPVFAAEWKMLGSYSVPLPALRNYRILSVNTVFFSAKHQNACGDTVPDPGQELLAWLERQLGDAAARKKKVWLMFHIAPGVDGFSTAMTPGTQPYDPVLMWKPEYSKGFDALLKRYQKTIAVSFAGHTHVDDFRLAVRKKSYKSLVLIEPAISPIYDQNPAFRVVSFEANGTLRDQATYYLANLASAGEAKPEWKLEYEFDEAWGAKKLDFGAVNKVWQKAGKPGPEREQWIQLYAVQHPGNAINERIFPLLYCASGNIAVADYAACVANQLPH